MRKILVIFLAMLTLLIFSGCTPVDALLDRISPIEETKDLPGKMVVQLDIVTSPYDEMKVRSYAGQESMSTLLRMLQNMQTTQAPDKEVSFGPYSKYYTITATYVNGTHAVYHLLDGMYLRSQDENWSIIDAAKFREFEQFLVDHPTGDAAPLPTDEHASQSIT